MTTITKLMLTWQLSSISRHYYGEMVRFRNKSLKFLHIYLSKFNLKINDITGTTKFKCGILYIIISSICKRFNQMYLGIHPMTESKFVIFQSNFIEYWSEMEFTNKNFVFVEKTISLTFHNYLIKNMPK